MSFWQAAIEKLTGASKRHNKNTLFGFDSDFEVNQYNLTQPFEDGLVKSSDVYSINQMIARNTKSIKWILKKKTGEKIEEVKSGQLYDLINNPNENQTREEFVEACSLDYTLSGNLFLHPQVSMGFTRPTSCEKLHPQLTEIKTNYVGKINTVDKYIYRIGGNEFPIAKEEITHLKYANPSNFGICSLRGLSPLTAGYLTMIGLNGNQTASASIYKNQGVAGVLSNESDYALTPEQRDNQQKLFDSKFAGAKLFGKIIQSAAKVKFTKLGLDPTQLKLIESKLLKMRDLCNIYDINSALLNDPENKVYNNVKEAETSFWKKVVVPNCNAIKAAYERAVVDKYNKAEFPKGNSKYFIELDLESIEALQRNKLDEATKDKLFAEAYSIMLRDRIITPQQYAEMMGVEYDPKAINNNIS